jgi:hypothetical protein
VSSTVQAGPAWCQVLPLDLVQFTSCRVD